MRTNNVINTKSSFDNIITRLLLAATVALDPAHGVEVYHLELSPQQLASLAEIGSEMTDAEQMALNYGQVYDSLTEAPSDFYA